MEEKEITNLEGNIQVDEATYTPQCCELLSNYCIFDIIDNRKPIKQDKTIKMLNTYQIYSMEDFI